MEMGVVVGGRGSGVQWGFYTSAEGMDFEVRCARHSRRRYICTCGNETMDKKKKKIIGHQCGTLQLTQKPQWASC